MTSGTATRVSESEELAAEDREVILAPGLKVINGENEAFVLDSLVYEPGSRTAVFSNAADVQELVALGSLRGARKITIFCLEENGFDSNIFTYLKGLNLEDKVTVCHSPRCRVSVPEGFTTHRDMSEAMLAINMFGELQKVSGFPPSVAKAIVVSKQRAWEICTSVANP